MKAQVPQDRPSTGSTTGSPTVDLRALASTIVGKPIGKLDRADVATIIWQRVGEDPNHGIAKLADIAKVSETDLVAALANEAAYEARQSEQWWKHLTLEAIGALVLGVLVILAGWSLHATFWQEESGLDGFQEAVTRSFAGTIRVTFTVVEFDTEDHAAAGFRHLGDRIENGQIGNSPTRIDDVESTTIPASRDASAAYQGTVRIGAMLQPVSVVIVRDGTLVHIMTSLGSVTEGGTDPTAIMNHLFGASPYAELVPRAGATDADVPEHTTGGLWDRLPSPQDLPDGYVVIGETTDDHVLPGR